MPIALIYIYTSTVLAILLIGFFVISQNSKAPINRSFFGMTLFQVIWILSLFLGYYYAFDKPANLYASEVFVQTAYGSGLILMFSLILFLYHFPRKSISFKDYLPWVYSVVMMIVALIATFTDLVHNKQIIQNGFYIADTFGPLYPMYSALLILSLLLAIYILAKKLITLKGLERRKVLYVTTGCLLCGFTIITTNLVLPYYGKTWLGEISLLQISPIYTLLFILPTFYSIYKHRFFNFTYVSFHFFRALIFYGVFLLSTFAFFVLLLTVFSNQSYYLLFGSSALLALILNQKIQAYIPEFVSGELREFRRVTTEFKTSILSGENLKSLRNAIENTFVVQLNFVNAKLYVLRENGDNFDLPVYQKNAFTKALTGFKHDALVKAEIELDRSDNLAQKKLLSTLTKLDADFLMPLFSENNLIGFFILKKKADAPIYAKEEVDELMGLKRRLEVSLMNQLLKLNLEAENNLMREIIERKTKQLKQKIDEVNELLKQQADFIAVTAHEFRTPLTIATFQVDNLLHSKKSAKEILKDMKVVEESINNIKTLTEKLFRVQQYDLNKVELHPEKTDLNEFVERLYEDFCPIMKSKGLRFEFKKGVKKKLMANVDRAQFRQVIHNLLTNASKFTPKDGLVALSIRGGKKGTIEINVDDNGSGIPDDLKLAIFEKFRTKAVGAGLGLGLYLCKKIIALHKGKLWIEDSPLGGASFRIRMKGA